MQLEFCLGEPAGGWRVQHIAADDAEIGFPATRYLGPPPNQMWLYHCGPQWTKRLLLTGDTITGRAAAQIGLVLKSVPAHSRDAEVARPP